MADGKIYITISDTRGGSGSGVSNDDDKGSNKKGNTAFDYAKHRFFNFIEGQAKQFVNYTVSNIGNFSGSYIAQNEIENAMKTLSFAINLGTSVVVGAKAGGPVGAAVAAAITIGSEMINFGLREKSEQFEMRRTNRNIAMMRERLGLEGLTNGSRSGGY